MNESESTGQARFRFSLGGLFVLVFGCAVGLSVANLEEPTWEHGVLAAVATWCVLGLFYQCRDLVHARTTAGMTQVEMRRRWQWAIFWRIAMIGVFVVLYVFEYLDASGVLKETDDGWWFSASGDCMREVTLLLCVLIVIRRPSRQPSRVLGSRILSKVYSVFLWIALLFALVWLGIDNALLPFLVHVAIQGIRSAMPLLFFDGSPNPNAYVDISAIVERFWWMSMLVLSFVPLNLACVYQLARQWNRGYGRRIAISLGLCAGLAIVASYVVWTYAVVFPRISPEMAANPNLGVWHEWLFAALLVAIFTTACSIRFLRSSDLTEPIFFEAASWDTSRYYQYHRGTMAILCVACFALLVRSAAESWWGVLGSFDYLFDEPNMSLLLAVLIVALQRLLRRRDCEMSQIRLSPFAVSPGRLAAVWLAMFATIVSGVPTMYWFGFAVWLVSG